jgi:hypothetical protein
MSLINEALRRARSEAERHAADERGGQAPPPTFTPAPFARPERSPVATSLIASLAVSLAVGAALHFFVARSHGEAGETRAGEPRGSGIADTVAPKDFAGAPRARPQTGSESAGTPDRSLESAGTLGASAADESAGTSKTGLSGSSQLIAKKDDAVSKRSQPLAPESAGSSNGRGASDSGSRPASPLESAGTSSRKSGGTSVSAESAGTSGASGISASSTTAVSTSASSPAPPSPERRPQTVEERSYVGEAVLPSGAKITLGGIISGVTPLVMLNGRMIGVGEFEADCAVVKIEPRRVLLRGPGGPFWITLP